MPANDVVLLDSLIEKASGYLGSDLEQSALFELFCFDQILKNYDLSYDELESGHVDGGDDGGIDGLFVFLDDNLITDMADVEIRSVRRNPEIEIIVTTCKNGTQFKQIPINNLISSLSELLDLRKTSKDILYPFDASILEIRETFRRLYVELADKSPLLKINVYYASRGDTTNLNPNISSRAKDLEIRLSSLFSQVETQVVFLGASELLQLARKQRSYSLRISFIENVISRAKTNYIILTTLSDYYRFITDEDDQLRRYLFEANVRDYFGPNNNVIADIRDSLESKLSKDEADFWWFSNGITLLASSAMIVGKELSLENVQIVNGLQTSNAIYEHFSRIKRNNDDRALLLKIVVADNEDIRVKIIKATNYQNVVDLASLRATDKIQRDIEEYLLGHNWFYDRRKNYYKNQGKPADRIVSTSLLGAVIRALVLRNPNAAAEQQTRWMKNDQDYAKVFDPNCSMRVFLVCLEICKIIDPYMRDKTRPAGRLPYIDDKKAKYIVGLIYLANILRSTAYTTDEIAKVEKYPDLGDIKMIVGHVLTCFEKYESDFETKSKKARNLASSEFIAFALNELENNNFDYLPYSVPSSDKSQAADDKESPKQTEKTKVAERLRLASEYDFERNFNAAIEELNACLQEDLPEHRQATIHSHMGRIYAKMGDAKSSIEHYQTALSLGLQTSELYAGYARSLYKLQNDPDKIGSLFDTAIRLDKTNARAHNWYATFLKSIGEMEKAEEHAKKALQLMPNHPLFLHNLALFLMEKKDKDSLLQAKDLLEKSVARARPGFDYPKQVLQDVQNMLATFQE